MASDSLPPRPTDAEIAILRVLWARGRATVRDVHEALKGERGTGYTTVLKLMQIMADKGLVDRDVSRRSHVYRARVGETETQDRLVDDLVTKAFGGSATRLVMRALSTQHSTPAELAKLRSLLNELASAGDEDDDDDISLEEG